MTSPSKFLSALQYDADAPAVVNDNAAITEGIIATTLSTAVSTDVSLTVAQFKSAARYAFTDGGVGAGWTLTVPSEWSASVPAVRGFWVANATGQTVTVTTSTPASPAVTVDVADGETALLHSDGTDITVLVRDTTAAISGTAFGLALLELADAAALRAAAGLASSDSPTFAGLAIVVGVPKVYGSANGAVRGEFVVEDGNAGIPGTGRQIILQSPYDGETTARVKVGGSGSNLAFGPRDYPDAITILGASGNAEFDYDVDVAGTLTAGIIDDSGAGEIYSPTQWLIDASGTPDLEIDDTTGVKGNTLAIVGNDNPNSYPNAKVGLVQPNVAGVGLASAAFFVVSATRSTAAELAADTHVAVSNGDIIGGLMATADDGDDVRQYAGGIYAKVNETYESVTSNRIPIYWHYEVEDNGRHVFEVDGVTAFDIAKSGVTVNDDLDVGGTVRADTFDDNGDGKVTANAPMVLAAGNYGGKVTLDDDTVHVVDLSGWSDTNLVTEVWTTNASIGGYVKCRVVRTLSTTSLLEAGTQGVLFSDTDLTDGTSDGTDTYLNVSCHDGYLHVKNRMGAVRSIKWKITGE